MNMATHVISCKYYVYNHTNLDMVQATITVQAVKAILVITGCVFGNDTLAGAITRMLACGTLFVYLALTCLVSISIFVSVVIHM